MAAATGRKPGRPPAMGRLARLRLVDEAPALLDLMLRQARLGDPVALGWCLDRALDIGEPRGGPGAE